MRRTTFLTALAFLAIPTIASAHAGNLDANMVHVCIGNVSKVVRSVGVGGVCISGPPAQAETADHWPTRATAGPKGDKGDRGDQGIQGLQGPQGSPGTNGADGASVRFVSYVLPGDATCPNGGAFFATGDVKSYVCNGQNGTTGTPRADLPCFNDETRYVDCRNGTVTDTVTGLIWLQDADCWEKMNWVDANGAAAALANGQCGLTDGSSAGDWRLPTKDEWTTIILRGIALGCWDGLLTNDAGTACLSVGPSSFVGVRLATYYWTSSTSENSPRSAWSVLLSGSYFPNFGVHVKPVLSWVWPVRGGPR